MKKIERVYPSTVYLFGSVLIPSLYPTVPFFETAEWRPSGMQEYKAARTGNLP
jgi:hypothetical protein